MANADGVYVLAPKQFIIPEVSAAAGNIPTGLSGAFYLSGNYAYILTKNHLYQLSGAIIL